MSEQQLPEDQNEQQLPDLSADDMEIKKAPGNVEIVHGAYSRSLPLAGSTIAEIREEAEEELGIPKDARPVVDGQEVDENYIIQADQTVTFVKHAGEKG